MAESDNKAVLVSGLAGFNTHRTGWFDMHDESMVASSSP
jgi:hypothetical protein